MEEVDKYLVSVSVIVAAQSYEKRCPVFLFVKRGNDLFLPGEQMFPRRGPEETAWYLLDKYLDIKQVESEEWVNLTVCGVAWDKTFDELHVAYSCILPETCAESDTLVWKSIPEIMPVNSGVNSIDMKLLQSFSMGGR